MLTRMDKFQARYLVGPRFVQVSQFFCCKVRFFLFGKQDFDREGQRPASILCGLTRVEQRDP